MSVVEVLTEGLLALYYPVRELRGTVPQDGVYIVVANHPNGLIDPVLVRILLRRRPAFLAKSTFWDNPVSRWTMQASHALPVYRAHEGDTSKNDETFRLCREHLKGLGWLALFPEGKSHSEPTLQALKTGAARIALSTLDEAPGLPLRVLPIGLFYEDKVVFRSRAAGSVGEPVEVADLLDAYRADPRHATEVLTERIEAALSAVVLQGQTEELRRAFYAVAGWTQPRQGTGGSSPPRGDVAAREAAARALASRWAESDRDQRAAAVAAFVQFERRMTELGVDDPLAVLDSRPSRVLARTLGLVALAPLAAVGACLGWLPYRAVRPVASRVANGSTDVEATVKVLLGALVMTVHYLALALFTGLALGGSWGLAAMLVGPLSGYLALRFDERWALRREALRGLWLARDVDVRAAVERERQALIRLVG